MEWRAATRQRAKRYWIQTPAEEPRTEYGWGLSGEWDEADVWLAAHVKIQSGGTTWLDPYWLRSLPHSWKHDVNLIESVILHQKPAPPKNEKPFGN